MIHDPSEEEETHSRPFLRILMQETVPIDNENHYVSRLFLKQSLPLCSFMA